MTLSLSFKVDRSEIIAANPLPNYLESRGVMMKGESRHRTSNRCALTEHRPGHQCVAVDTEQGVWFCNDCGKGGSVIDWESLAAGVSIGEAMRRLGGEVMPEPGKTIPAPSSRNGGGKSRLVKTYDYTDESGKLLFQVCRFEPKDFRQRQPDGSGWKFTMEGARRVLYRLPEILAADLVWIAEGEKDADTLAAMGLVATTNVGGAKKWDASYSVALRGKDVVIVPDNDKAGEEHRDTLVKALASVAKSIRIVTIPDGFKDVTDWTETYASPNAAASDLLGIAEQVEVLYRGESVPVQTMAEMETEYREHIARAATHQFPLGSWLPGFREVRALVPGELVAILAGTGCGKTMLLQNIALATHLPTLLFEVELPGSLSFERFAGMATKTSGAHVESTYRVNGSVDWKAGGKLNHIFCVHKSSVKTSQIRRIIETCELKTCRRPVLVLIDYIQLVQGEGSSRYEAVSGVAEQLKVIAKDTGTIIIMASQIGRAATAKQRSETQEVSLTDAKESGSIENSSGLVIGAWRDGNDPGRLWLRILKNTKGKAGRTLPCRIHESLLITQEADEPK